MLKTLRNKSKKLLILKIRIVDFLKKRLWQHLIVLSSILLCAWIFDRWIESIMFCVAHTCVRNAFDKQFHFTSIPYATAYCLSLTLAIIWFAIPTTLPLAVSLLSSIPIAFVICFIGFVVQDRLDLKVEVKRLDTYATELVRTLTHKDIYTMNEDELYEHCRNCGLDEEDCKIAYFVVIERLQGRELYDALPYSEATIKRKRIKIMNKIKAQPKNITTIEH